jgi:acetyl/propionyl-CoA carboxylase alpha subunit
MIKAVHGGGGKGMRPAWNDKELDEGCVSRVSYTVWFILHVER